MSNARPGPGPLSSPPSGPRRNLFLRGPDDSGSDDDITPTNGEGWVENINPRRLNGQQPIEIRDEDVKEEDSSDDESDDEDQDEDSDDDPDAVVFVSETGRATAEWRRLRLKRTRKLERKREEKRLHLQEDQEQEEQKAGEPRERERQRERQLTEEEARKRREHHRQAEGHRRAREAEDHHRGLERDRQRQLQRQQDEPRRRRQPSRERNGPNDRRRRAPTEESEGDPSDDENDHGHAVKARFMTTERARLSGPIPRAYLGFEINQKLERGARNEYLKALTEHNHGNVTILQFDRSADLRCKNCKDESIMTCSRIAKHQKCMRCVRKHCRCSLREWSDAQMMRRLPNDGLTRMVQGLPGAERRADKEWANAKALAIEIRRLREAQE